VLGLQPSANLIIEKPVVNNLTEIEALMSLRTKYPRAKFFVDENYCFSNSIPVFKKIMAKYRIRVRQIRCEFTKNRIKDLERNRFVDSKLGPFGIEISHIVAITEMLGFRFETLIRAKQFSASAHSGKISGCEDCELVYSTEKGQLVEVWQSLSGKIKFVHPCLVIPRDKKKGKFRMVWLIGEDGYNLFLQLEPIEGYPRFTARVVLERQGKVVEEIVVPDESLRNSLSCALRYFSGNLKRLPRKGTLDFGLRIAAILCGAADAAKRRRKKAKSFDQLFPDNFIF